MTTTGRPRYSASEIFPPVEAVEAEVRRADDLAPAELARRALVLRRDLPDEKPEEPGDERDGETLGRELQTAGHGLQPTPGR